MRNLLKLLVFGFVRAGYPPHIKTPQVSTGGIPLYITNTTNRTIYIKEIERGCVGVGWVAWSLP
jgi:hypothetical protein